MRHPISILLVALLCLVVTQAQAFSPYQAYLESGRRTHVGLLATVVPGKETELQQAIKKCGDTEVEAQLAKAEIDSLQFFSSTIDGQQYVVAYFSYKGGTQYLGAAKAFEAATESIDWSVSTTSHPRAKTYGRHWLQMEWINFIHGLDVDRSPTSTLMIGTTIKPEKEREYRTLHQTVWPGVIDQVVRGNIRNLNVFLVEIDDRLVEFLYLEYMGNDQQADDAASKQDPISQRWWKLTDDCQKPFSDVTEGTWAELKKLNHE
ncbi:L-rhamnose mutarotase [Aeoliella sp. ICT_H6.2]|uniref:L-rhamnose mutarotase n=1 Tax=Aeoliella straminimaris TaxID=2954799 RepID=A0A9X2JHV5_9BACT|nr:L-rhamnose mutarotase [Aeoliella straminimaris]MCO6046211.1 L-rhamnose mutarotase [Aeoliella straminimaris]